MAFPEPLLPPQEFFTARKLRSKTLLQITFWGIFVRFLIALFELCGFAFSGSSVLLIDALSTFADVVSSLLLIVSIKLAERPPDREHPFGHGRYEPIVGLQLGLFLTLAGLCMFVYEFLAFWNLEKNRDIDPRMWLIPLLACVLLEIAYARMKKVAKDENSPALLAEAFHFRVDSLNSIVALCALILAALFPAWGWVFDRLGALGIAFFMCVVGLMAAKSNLNQLLDRIPEPEYFEKIRQAAKSVAGVLETEKLLIQLYGPDAHIDIDVEVDPLLTVECAHTISQQVRNAIQKTWPQVRDVIVHIEPYYENDHNFEQL